MTNNSPTPKLKPLRFGIPSLDQLIGQTKIQPPSGTNKKNVHWYGINTQTGSSSVCIMGPDGAGKSILALHLASRYAADCHEWYSSLKLSKDPLEPPYRPQILYVSTDLLVTKARAIWGDPEADANLDASKVGFKLYNPNGRSMPHHYQTPPDTSPNESGLWGNPYSKQVSAALTSWKLMEVLPPNHKRSSAARGTPFTDPTSATIDEFLKEATKANAQSKHQIGFLDLAAHTAGDDWSYINRVLSVLPAPDSSHEHPYAKHLMIIDAIEGLEVLAGEHDAFGERRTRRSRIAQLVRTAAEKCHLVFIVEEMQEGERLAEEFVADLVIHLRAHGGSSVRRTLEVVKSRGQAHKSGEHDYVIRSGQGTLTGDQVNPDEPSNANAYIHVMQGVDSLFQDIAADDEKLELSPQYPPTFGVRYLDSLLGYNVEGDKISKESEINGKREVKPLPLASPYPFLTAVIGDVATYKSSLSYAFLSECFAPESQYWEQYKESVQAQSYLFDPLSEKIEEQPVAILLTTQLVDAKMLAAQIWNCLSQHNRERYHEGKSESDALTAIQDRIICRRLPVRDLSSAQFFHIIESALWEARAKIKKRPVNERARWRSNETLANIRIAIDDWHNVKSLYPAVARDPQLLPFLSQYLQWQQVSALIVDTQPGDPETVRRSESGRDLRSLVQRHIYTWHVPFYKEDRIAIAVLPGIQNSGDGLATSARELLIAPSGNKLSVDPHFERYSGLERGDSHPLPLQVMLYTGSSRAEQYLEDTNALLSQLFVGRANGRVVQNESAHNYEALRQLAYTPRGTRLDHTLILQVDEFWQHSQDQQRNLKNPSSNGARFCLNYLNARTISAAKIPTPEDPFLVYQPTATTKYHDLGVWQKYGPRNTKLSYLTHQHRRRHSFFPLLQLGYSDHDRGKRLKIQNHRTPSSINDIEAMWIKITCFKIQEKKLKEQVKNLTIKAEQSIIKAEKRDIKADRLKSETERLDVETKRRELEIQYKEEFNKLEDSDFVESHADSGCCPGYLEDLHMMPMIWDFGFLLCRRRSWIVAASRTINLLFHPDSEESQRPPLKLKPYKVSDIWNPANSDESSDTPKPAIEWYDFLQACKEVARMQQRQGHQAPVVAFDYDQHGPSSLSCLILEMWASELHLHFKRTTPPEASASTPPDKSMRCFPQWRADKDLRAHGYEADKGLTELLDELKEPEAVCALFRAFLLFLGATEPEQFPESTVATERGAAPSAVAARHWYSTASRVVDEWDPEDPLVPVRLPGHFSVRGDWFLTIADGSQSPQLAKAAMDLLTSGRANLTRMEAGVGLPTRRIHQLDSYRTALFTIAKEPSAASRNLDNPDDSAERSKRHLRYGELCDLGAKDSQDFRWLWRSRLRHYHRHGRIWNQWIFNLARTWHRRAHTTSFSNLDAFKLYITFVKMQEETTPEDQEQAITRSKSLIENGVNDATLNLVWQYYLDMLKELRSTLEDATLLMPSKPNTSTSPDSTEVRATRQ